MAQVISEMPAPIEVPPEERYTDSREVQSVPKESVITIDFKDLPILKEGAKLIKGRTIDSPVINISNITSKMNNITVWGDVFDYSEKDIRTKNGEKRVVSISITDYTSSISVKSFENKEDENVLAAFKKGGTVLLKGKADFDTFDRSEERRVGKECT